MLCEKPELFYQPPEDPESQSALPMATNGLGEVEHLDEPKDDFLFTISSWASILHALKPREEMGHPVAP